MLKEGDTHFLTYLQKFSPVFFVLTGTHRQNLEPITSFAKKTLEPAPSHLWFEDMIKSLHTSKERDLTLTLHRVTDLYSFYKNSIAERHLPLHMVRHKHNLHESVCRRDR